ncbi:MAG: TolC family protein [Proteobacteria bacterium]|nr:TolC family protein [Pseudomonadota bacterium]
MKPFFLSRPSRAALLALPCLAGCAAYFDTAPNPAVAHKVEARLKTEEGLPIDKLVKSAPESVEQALPKFKERKEQAGRSLPQQQPGSPPVPKAPPEASKPLTIADARALALENNLDLKIALIDPKIAATSISEEEAKFDDLIFAKAKYANKYTPALNQDVVAFTPVDPDSPLKGQEAKLTAIPQRTDLLELDAGVVIPLRTGGKITLSAPFDEKKQLKGVPSDQYLSALRFSISQPLLRDAGIDNNVAGIRIARYEQQVVDVKTRLQAIRVLAAIDRAYWALYVVWGELDVRRQQYENAADNLAMVRKRVAEGLTAAVEINRAEIGVAERVEGLIIAETSLKLRQRQLKLMLNDPRLGMDTPTVLVPQTPPTLVSFDFDREQLVNRALDGRLELLELELKLAADLTKVDYLRNQTLPMFMLDYSYASLGRDTTSFGGAFSQAINGDYSDWSVGVRMEYPVSNELRRSKLERAVQERLQRLTTKQLRELSVKREIYDALDQLGQNWQRILAARQNVLLAGLNYDAELRQFREGMRTMTEVLETLTRLGEAQLREVRAIGDYQASLIDLAFALGHSRVAMNRPSSAGKPSPAENDILLPAP